MAGDASVPFSFAEVWEEKSSRDKRRLRSRSREHRTYNAGGVARDVAEDDDGGFLAAQRRPCAQPACVRQQVPMMYKVKKPILALNRLQQIALAYLVVSKCFGLLSCPKKRFGVLSCQFGLVFLVVKNALTIPSNSM